MSAAVTAVDHIKIVIDAVAMAIVKTQEVLEKTWKRIRDDASGTVAEIAKAGFSMSPAGMIYNAVAGSDEEKKPSEFSSDMAGIGEAFMSELADGFVELEKKKEAREAASLAARQKTDQAGLAGGGGGGGGGPTKVKADALARIGGFRGGISPEINLLKQQVQQQKMIARASKKTAENTQVLKP